MGSFGNSLNSSALPSTYPPPLREPATPPRCLPPMLEALNLTKTFIGPPAVDSVSFTIRPGEILGYLGPNGAGKSTTVKMLTGLLEPTSGRVLFHGQDIRRDLKGFQRCLGYVPEEPHLYPHLSGREYLQLAGPPAVGGPFPAVSSSPKWTNSSASSASGTTATPRSPLTPRACARRSSSSPLSSTTPNCSSST